MTVTGRPAEQRPALIDVEDFFADPQFADPSISPDGTRIAYLAPHRGRRNVWVRGVDQDHEQAPSRSRATPAAGSAPTTGPTTPAGCSTGRTPTATRRGTCTVSISTTRTSPPST